MRAVVILFMLLACVLLIGGFNALEGPAALILAVIASGMLIVSLVGGYFLRSRSGPQ